MNEDTKHEQSSTAGAARQGGVTSEESGGVTSIPPSTAPAPQTDLTQIAWAHDLQERLMVADDQGDDELHNLLGEVACCLCALTGRPGTAARAEAAPAPQQSEPKAKAGATTGRATEIAARLPNGVVVTNVYEAYEAGLAKAAQAAPSAKAEPVAYMVRREVDGHVFGTYQHSFEAERVKSWSEDAIVIPLYTAPAPAVQAEDVRNHALDTARLDWIIANPDVRVEQIGRVGQWGAWHSVSGETLGMGATPRAAIEDAMRTPSTSQTSEGESA